MSEPENPELVRTFLLHPMALKDALRRHVDDGTGKCRTCRGGGTVPVPQPWPCPWRDAADEAARCRRDTPIRRGSDGKAEWHPAVREFLDGLDEGDDTHG